jgi:hypothetical protein
MLGVRVVVSIHDEPAWMINEPAAIAELVIAKDLGVPATSVHSLTTVPHPDVQVL